MKWCAVILLVAILFASTEGNDRGPVNLCKAKSTCSECITAAPQCTWCGKENFTEEGKARCDFYDNLVNQNCPYDQITQWRNTGIPKSKPFSAVGADPKEIVQLMPQHIFLEVRPNDPYPFEISFRQAEDYPVDLYYLMDLSKSMEDDKERLAELGTKLANTMGTITKDFKLGFGSFVDKTVMPYVSTVPEKMAAPCTGCAAPYGFKNHMPLDDKPTTFESQVRDARVSGNLDAPEGGFDAIMQSIVCHNEIGWRNLSRKLLIFSTDSGFHYAGDGKLGGIVKPNDGACHLDTEGTYNHSILQDYPSLSQLRQKVTEKKVNIIFAVTSGQVNIYKQLSTKLEGAYTGQLANDSSNVVDLVRDQYNNITSELEMKDTAPPHVKLTYYSSCLGTKREKTNVCKGLKLGHTVNFTVELEVLHCPKDPKDWNQVFQISPVGVGEVLTVHLKTICECDCEKPGAEETNSSKCSGNGTYECGACTCYGKFGGNKCECIKGETKPGTVDNESGCKQNVSDELCSSRGSCSCGGCKCHIRPNPEETVYGAYCECDDFSCDRHMGKLCSGPDHGHCKCRNCICNPQWTDNACQCPAGNSSCTGKDGLLCSGKGVCKCGVCKCIDRYSGPFCDECPVCVGKCKEYKECVQCMHFRDNQNKEDCNCNITMEVVEEAKAENDMEKLCVFKDDDDCKFTFVYWYNGTSEPIIRVQSTKECPPAVNVLLIVLAVIGGIVAIGLCLLLIWKLLTTIHDRREFAKFEKERMMAKWEAGENPIFKKATSNFTNPTYGGKQ